MKLIKIKTIYGDKIIRNEIKRNDVGIYTEKGFIPFGFIESIEIIRKIKQLDLFGEVQNE